MFKKITQYFRFLNLLAVPEHYEWTIALRKKNGKALYEGNNSPFIVVPNSDRYWAADPFLVKDHEKNYLFAELYDRIQEKGVIGVAKITHGKCGRFRVCLESPYHLSYPCIYQRDGFYYMIPECYQSGKITVYKCVDFPMKWEKDRDLAEFVAVDTTPVPNCIDEIFLTTVFNSKENRINNNISYLQGGKCIRLIDNDLRLRSAGNFILDDGRLIRPVQDCSTRYGGALLFNEVMKLNEEELIESTIATVQPNIKGEDGNIPICVANGTSKFSGIHTYNQNEDYEVIDLRIDDLSHLRYFSCFIKHFAEYLRFKIKGGI